MSRATSSQVSWGLNGFTPWHKKTVMKAEECRNYPPNIHVPFTVEFLRISSLLCGLHTEAPSVLAPQHPARAALSLRGPA